MSQIVKYTLLTKAGQLDSFVEDDSDMEADEIAKNLTEILRTRPQWMSLGAITFFSGAVSAIGVDIYDSIDDADESNEREEDNE